MNSHVMTRYPALLGSNRNPIPSRHSKESMMMMMMMMMMKNPALKGRFFGGDKNGSHISLEG